MKVEYSGLEDLIKNERVWNDIPQIKSLTTEERYDLIRGILDDICWWHG